MYSMRHYTFGLKKRVKINATSIVYKRYKENKIINCRDILYRRVSINLQVEHLRIINFQLIFVYFKF